MDMDSLTSFLGWCLLVNIGLLLLSTLAVQFLRPFLLRIHGSMFHIAEDDLNKMYFDYLARFKMLVIVFNLAPYCGLKLMS